LFILKHISMQVSKDLIKQCAASGEREEVQVVLRYVNVKIMYESPKVKLSDATRITSSRVGYRVLISQYDPEIIGFREVFYCIYVNRANRVIAVVKISEGTTSATLCDSKLILMFAIGLCASGIIVGHNHPSGSIQPSENDKKITKQIKDAARLLEVNLLDHIIVTPDEGEYYSFADEGML
jgi:DNA repair protein RadC